METGDADNASLLIGQDAAHVERFTRLDDGPEWVGLEVDGLDASVELPSIGCTLALRDVYENVDFPPRGPLRAVYEREDVGYALVPPAE